MRSILEALFAQFVADGREIDSTAKEALLAIADKIDGVAPAQPAQPDPAPVEAPALI